MWGWNAEAGRPRWSSVAGLAALVAAALGTIVVAAKFAVGCAVLALLLLAGAAFFLFGLARLVAQALGGG